MRPLVIALLLGVLATALVLARCDYIETPVATYATYADALADSAHIRGWLPPYVPLSATDIREVHTLDTNRQWLRFRVPVADARRMVDGMAILPYAEVRMRPTSPRRWRGPWPPEITGRSIATPRSTDRLSYHRARTDSISAQCVAVEWAEGLVYAWSCETPVA